MAVDNQGNVVAAGFTRNTGTSRTSRWRSSTATVPCSGSRTSTAPPTVSTAHDPWRWTTRGTWSPPAPPKYRHLENFTVAKFDGDGTLLWQQTLNGTEANSFNDDALSVAVDKHGNVVAAGTTVNTGTSADFTVAKFTDEVHSVAGDTPCAGALPPGIYDNIIVPPGASCTLSASVVLGNVKALENSQLVIISSNVRGNVEGDKADLVQVNFSLVRENILIKEGGPAPIVPPGGFFCPPAFSSCEALVFHTIVEEGNVQIEKMVGTVWVGDNSIQKGNIKIEENFIPLDEILVIGANKIAQNLQVFKNTVPGGKFVDTSPNTAGESIQCFENSPPFLGGPNIAPKKEGQCF